MDLKYKIGLIASLLFLIVVAVRADEDMSPELKEVAENMREIDEDDETEDGLPNLMERDTLDPGLKSVEYKVSQMYLYMRWFIHLS